MNEFQCSYLVPHLANLAAQMKLGGQFFPGYLMQKSETSLLL